MVAPAPKGLHHVTCVANDWQRTSDFYEALGFSLVKNTVNHDAPKTRHTYHADGKASPGSVITFFEWPSERRAQPGLRSAHHVAIELPRDLDLDEAGANAGPLASAPAERIESEPACLQITDPDGLSLRLFEGRGDGPRLRWVGLYGSQDERARFYEELLGFEVDRSTPDAPLVTTEEGSPVLKLLPGTPGPGRIRPGGVHHVAFLAPEDTQEEFQARLETEGYETSGPIDRLYFRSVYSQDPEGHILELATPDPGFSVDEEPDELGSRLILPPWLEEDRETIEGALGPS